MANGPQDVRILFVTAPPDRAHPLAHALVESGLAACVNVVPGLRSVYRWKDAIEDDPESLLILKTAADRAEALAAKVVELHPAEVPEVLSMPLEGGYGPYIDWVVASTRPPAPPEDGTEQTEA